MQEITIATSIAPRGIEKQARAVDSWLQLGFEVISVNTHDEIALLSELFPNIRFIPTQRTALDVIGKKLIYINDVCLALQSCSTAICGIVNSDIVLTETSDLIPFLYKHCTDSFIFGQRLDVESLDSPEGYPYIRGFDYFFFEKAFIDSIPSANFFLGATWWDIWLPLVAEHSKLRLIQPIEKFALHQNHPIAWVWPDHCVLGQYLYDFLKSEKYSIQNNPIFTHAFENFQEYDGLCLTLLLDHIMEHSIALSISNQATTIIKTSPIVKPSEPDISLLFSEVSNNNISILLEFTDYIHQHDINNTLEMLFVVEFWYDNYIIYNLLMEKAYKYGNLNCIRFLNETSKYDALDTVRKIARGKKVLVLDHLTPSTLDENINKLQSIS